MNDAQGKLLIAPPRLPDWRFQKSVVYMWKHDIGGASGVIINKKCNFIRNEALKGFRIRKYEIVKKNINSANDVNIVC